MNTAIAYYHTALQRVFTAIALVLLLLGGAYLWLILISTGVALQPSSCSTACLNGTCTEPCVNGTAGTDGANGTCTTPCVNGTPGTPGANGTCTVPCVNGTQGPPGANGTCTVPCVNGTQGPPGANGTCTVPCVNGTQGPPGENGTCTAPCVNGTQGPPGENGTCTAPCVNGTQGPPGANGTQGPPGANGTCTCTTGVAEFIRTTQSPNDSVPPGTAFTIDTEVFNGVPSAVVASAGAGGTVFTLSTGNYLVQYELSLGSAGSVALYTGATAGSLSVDTNTIAGSSTATSWIHGASVVNVPSATLVIALSSHTGTAAIVTAGNAAGFYVVRMTILKVV